MREPEQQSEKLKSLWNKIYHKNFIIICSSLLKLGDGGSPSDWIKYAEEQIRGKSSSAEIRMEIKTPDWERVLEVKADSKGDNQALIFITAPAKEKGIGTLRQDNKLWNYFPKLKKSVVVSPSMLLTGWMGSDFTNDDLLKASSIEKDYNHKFLKTVTLENKKKYRLIECLAKSDAKVVWPKIVIFSSVENCLPAVQLYYDKSGELIRTLKLSDVKEMSGHHLPTVWEMIPKGKENQQTILKYLNIKYDLSFKENYFDLKTLSQD